MSLSVNERRTTNDERRVFKGWGALIGIPALFVLARVYDRIPGLANLETCVFKRVLGLRCPGCGLTTSLTALTNGNIALSLKANVLGVVISLWLVYVFARSVVTLFTGRRPRTLLSQGQRDVLLWMFLIVLVLQWIIKFL